MLSSDAYAASTATVEIHTKDAPNRPRPDVTTSLVPIRGASSAPTTEATAMVGGVSHSGRVVFAAAALGTPAAAM